MKIVDDFLAQDDFYELQTFMVGPEPGHTRVRGGSCPWYYNSIIDSVDDVDKFQFIHLFYTDWVPISTVIDRLTPIMNKINPLSFWRIKANLLTRTSSIDEQTFHTDISSMSEEKLKQWTTSIFYVNTNNGYTEFENGTKVESVANRMVTFPANVKHTGTSCTDERTRVVINFNYLIKNEIVSA